MHRVLIIFFDLQLDITLSEAQGHSPQRAVASHQSKDGARLTPRQQTIIELFQTESNYVGILHTILKVITQIRILEIYLETLLY